MHGACLWNRCCVDFDLRKEISGGFKFWWIPIETSVDHVVYSSKPFLGMHTIPLSLSPFFYPKFPKGYMQLLYISYLFGLAQQLGTCCGLRGNI